MKKMKGMWIAVIILAASLVLGQGISYLMAPSSWAIFFARLPVILSMIAFWGPIVAIIAGVFVWIIMRLMGFNTLEEIRDESVQQNNPTPAIIFVGTMIASILFLLLVIRP
jgi:hypothetical protein